MIEHPAGLVSAFADRMRKTRQKAASDADDQATRFRRNTARFSDTGPVSFLLSLALPLAVYFTGWYMRPLWFTSDAMLIFVGSSLVLAALRGSAGCEFLALSNWLLRRTDQIACAVFTPIDSLERLRSRS